MHVVRVAVHGVLICIVGSVPLMPRWLYCRQHNLRMPGRQVCSLQDMGEQVPFGGASPDDDLQQISVRVRHACLTRASSYMQHFWRTALPNEPTRTLVHQSARERRSARAMRVRAQSSSARLQVVLERGLQVVREELAPGQLVAPVVGEAGRVQPLQRLAPVRRGLVAHIPEHDQAMMLGVEAPCMQQAASRATASGHQA